MFVNFNKIFKEKEPTEHNIPPALLEYFNSSLPENFRYIIDEKGNCILVSEIESINIGGFKFAPTPEQKKIIGEHYTADDVISYCENSQQPIPLKLEKEGMILLNGKEVSIDKLIFNPFNPIKYDSRTLYMHPYAFPEPFPIVLGCEDYRITVMVKRVPNNSVSVAAFESDKNEGIYIKYYVDLARKTIIFNMTINFAWTNTIKDFVAYISIYTFICQIISNQVITISLCLLIDL